MVKNESIDMVFADYFSCGTWAYIPTVTSLLDLMQLLAKYTSPYKPDSNLIVVLKQSTHEELN